MASLLRVHGAPARAGSDAASRESKAHFGSALKWYNIEKYEAALEEFEAAYLAKSDPVYLFNIGQCYRFLKRHDKAILAYQNFLRDRPRAENRDVVETLIRGEQRAIDEEARLPAPRPPPPEPAMLSVRSTPPGATVTLDGAPIGTTPLRKALSPGQHLVRVEREGQEPREQAVDLVAGQQQEFAPEWIVAPPPKPAPPAESAPRRKLQRGGGALLGIGLAGAAAGVTLLVLDGRGTCSLPADARQCPQVYGTRWPGVAATVAGGALVAVGAAMLGISARQTERRVAVWPGLGPDGASIAIAGTF